MNEELVEELAQFDTSVVTVADTIKFIQAKLTQPQANFMPTLYVFRKAFGTGIHETMEIIDGYSLSELTVDEAIKEIRQIERF